MTLEWTTENVFHGCHSSFYISYKLSVVLVKDYVYSKAKLFACLWLMLAKWFDERWQGFGEICNGN